MIYILFSNINWYITIIIFYEIGLIYYNLKLKHDCYINEGIVNQCFNVQELNIYLYIKRIIIVFGLISANKTKAPYNNKIKILYKKNVPQCVQVGD